MTNYQGIWVRECAHERYWLVDWTKTVVKDVTLAQCKACGRIGMCRLSTTGPRLDRIEWAGDP